MSTTHNTPTIGTFLDVSTSAITEAENTILHQMSNPEDSKYAHVPVNVCEHGYGYWIWTGTTGEEIADVLPNLFRLLSYARQHGCRFVNLDADGADVPSGLPVFEW